MKKRMFPFGTLIILYFCFSLVVLGLGIFITINQSQSENGQLWRIIVIWVLFILIAFFAVSPFVMYQIKIDDTILSMNKDFGLFEEDRVQAKTSVDLNNITEYKVILSSKNSKGEPYKAKVQPRKFIAFTLKDGSIERLFVHNMNKKQILNLLSYIESKTGIEVSNE